LPPKTAYTRSGEVNIAYQLFGEGPAELVLAPAFMSNLDFNWIDPGMCSWLGALGTFTRVAAFDKRGMGLSDPVPTVPSMEERVADTLAVMDAAAFERPVLLGVSEGGASSIVLAAAHPQRIAALVLYGAYPKLIPDDDYLPELSGWAAQKRVRDFEEVVLARWGEGGWADFWLTEEGFELTDTDRRAFAAFERASASPAMARAAGEALLELDVCAVLSSIGVPTLILHRRGDPLHPIEHARYMAERIPGARFVELEGCGYAPWFGDMAAIVDEIREFVTGTRAGARSDRMLATILFTDICSSTERAAKLGDRRWREVLEAHNRASSAELERHGGRGVKSLGDGLLATFDGPIAAIRCARALQDATAPLGVELRAGLHTGECERIGEDVGGMAVHLAARVGEHAAPGEVLISETIRGLIIGSGIELEDRGEHDLRGVPGHWRLYAVADGEQPGTEPLPGPYEAMRPGDRATAALARRLPGVLRAISRRRMRRWSHT
jgi:pimeloyl-ACP methyl ester carboxylesterase